MTESPSQSHSSREVPRFRATAWAAVGAILLTSLGCLLVATRPSDDTVLECRVVVRNPELVGEVNEDEIEQPLFHLNEPFLAEDGRPMRSYTLVGSGGGCAGAFVSIGAAELDWSRFVRQRILEQAAAGEVETVFGRFPEQAESWCIVPSTLDCRQTGEVLDFCGPANDVLDENIELPFCVEPPAGPCREIDCGTDGPCETLDFGEIGVGESAARTVTISNGCEEGGPDELVAVDTIDPLDVQGDFSLLDLPADDPQANTCHPLMGDGERVTLPPGEECSFTVEFLPLNPGEHSAEVRGLDLELAGTAAGGSLTFQDVAESRDLACVGAGETPDSVCLEDAASPCTAPRVIRVANAGPGQAQISGVGIVSQDPAVPPGFQVTPELGPPDPPELLAAGETLDLAVEWCDEPGAQTTGRLVLDWNAPEADPCQTFRLRLGRPPCGP